MTQRSSTCLSPWSCAHMHNMALGQNRAYLQKKQSSTSALLPQASMATLLSCSALICAEPASASPCANTCSWSYYPNTIHLSDKIMLVTISFWNKNKWTLCFSNASPAHLPSWRWSHVWKLGPVKPSQWLQWRQELPLRGPFIGSAFLEVFLSNFSCLWRNMVSKFLPVIGVSWF